MQFSHLCEVILYVEDMHAQVRFYRDVLGLRHHHPQGIDDFSGEYWVTFDTGSCTLALHGGGQLRPGFAQDCLSHRRPGRQPARC